MLPVQKASLYVCLFVLFISSPGLDMEGHMVLLYVSFNSAVNIAKEILK